MEAADEPLEDGADKEKGGELHAGARREVHRCAECDRSVDVTPAGVRITASEQVQGNRQESTDEDDPEEGEDDDDDDEEEELEDEVVVDDDEVVVEDELEDSEEEELLDDEDELLELRCNEI